MPTLAKAAARGFAWLTLQSLATRAVQLLGQVMLARVLSPEDFGKIGLAYTIATFAGLVVNPGLDDVLVQRQRGLRLWATTGFWLGLSLGVIGGVGMLAAAPLGVALYNEPELFGLIMVLAIAAPIGATSIIPVAVMRSSLRFHLLAVQGTAEVVLLQILTLLFAYLGFGAYSFVLPVPLASAARSIVAWTTVRPRVYMNPQLRRWRYLLPNVWMIFGTRLLITTVAQGDYVLLGLMASHTVVGVYYFAYTLAALPVRTVAGNLIQVMFPTLTLLAEDHVGQGKAALKASRALATVAVPLCFLQAGVCRPVLHILFGDKWDAAVPLVQILSIGLVFDAVTWTAAALLQAKGQFRRILTYSCMAAPLFLVLVAVGASQWSAPGVAAGVAAYYITLGPLYVFLVLRPHAVSWSQVATLYLIPVTLGAVSVGTGNSASRVLAAAGATDWLQIAVTTILSCLLYLPMSWWLATDVWSTLRSALQRILKQA